MNKLLTIVERTNVGDDPLSVTLETFETLQLAHFRELIFTSQKDDGMREVREQLRRLPNRLGVATNSTGNSSSSGSCWMNTIRRLGCAVELLRLDWEETQAKEKLDQCR